VVIIVDTLASTSSKEEIDADWGKQDYARQPKELRRGFRRLMREFNRSNVLSIFTNQVSDSYASKRTDKYLKMSVPDTGLETFGGKAVKYYSAIRLFISQVIPVYKLVKGQRFAAGFVSEVFTKKNKRIKPFRKARFTLLYDGGLSNAYSTLETLVWLKLAERAEDGEIELMFDKAGIVPKTFVAGGTSADLDAPKIVDNPVVQSRLEWQEFYEEHRVDIDALWAHAVFLMFNDETATVDVVDDDDDIISGDEE
jgi:hypothetical protein